MESSLVEPYKLHMASAYQRYDGAMNLPPGHPTLLRHPVPDGLPYSVELFLELPASAYDVEQKGD